MKGITSRITRLESSISCPAHKIRLTCPECIAAAPEEMTDAEKIGRIRSFLGVAAIRALPPDAREQVRERIEAGDQLTITEYALRIEDLAYAMIDAYSDVHLKPGF
jgi:hypothetical protein